MKSSFNFQVTLFLCLANVFVSAQSGPVQATRGMKISDVYVLGGFISSNQAGTVEDFRSLAPGSLLLQNNFSSFSGNGEEYYDGSGMYSVLVGIHFRDQKKEGYRVNPQFRIGFSYFSGPVLINNLWHEIRTPWDTLTSSQTGQYYLLDSVITEDYSMEYATDQALLEASLIYRTRPEARWSLYGGIGLAVGFSINATTSIDYYKNSGVSVNDENAGYYSYPVHYSSETSLVSEYFRNENNVALSMFIPLGLDFRIARKSEFWQKLHLFYEMRPGLLFTFVPETRTISQGVFQSTFGLRVEIR